MLTQHAGHNIYANHAADYAEHGLIVFPTGKENGKIPLVKYWNKFGSNSWERYIDKYPSANIGIINGKGKHPICAIDIDDPKLLQEAVDTFGETLIIIQTPSGGYHLWYSYNQEYRKIRFKGQEIDVLGKGGFMIAPPSYRPNCGPYGFIEGDVTDIPNLPRIKQGNVANNNLKALSDVGNRNDQLFYFCKKKAQSSDTESELLEIAISYNNDFNPPLSINEVQKVVFKIWEYKTDGNLLNKGDNKMIIDLGLLSLSSKPDALALILTLQRNHGAKTTPFAIDQEKMQPILGWGGRRRVRNAVEVLIYEELLKFVGKGGPTALAYQYRLLI